MYIFVFKVNNISRFKLDKIYTYTYSGIFKKNHNQFCVLLYCIFPTWDRITTQRWQNFSHQILILGYNKNLEVTDNMAQHFGHIVCRQWHTDLTTDDIDRVTDIKSLLGFRTSYELLQKIHCVVLLVQNAY